MEIKVGQVRFKQMWNETYMDFYDGLLVNLIFRKTERYNRIGSITICNKCFHSQFGNTFLIHFICSLGQTSVYRIGNMIFLIH